MKSINSGKHTRLHRFLLTCTGYCSPSVFLTRSVCLCSSAWKSWPLPIFLISVLALQLLWVVLGWDLQLEVILLCRDTGQSGFKVFCCGWYKMLEQIAGWTQRFVGWSWDFRETFENTLVQSWFFWLGTHFWVCVTFGRVRYNVRLIIIIIKLRRILIIFNQVAAARSHLWVHRQGLWDQDPNYSGLHIQQITTKGTQRTFNYVPEANWDS